MSEEEDSGDFPFAGPAFCKNPAPSHMIKPPSWSAVKKVLYIICFAFMMEFVR